MGSGEVRQKHPWVYGPRGVVGVACLSAVSAVVAAFWTHLRADKASQAAAR
jgi:hypothetical protein